VLGKKDLKQLLQWREQCRQHLGLETEDGGDVEVRSYLNCALTLKLSIVCAQVEPLDVEQNSDDELESALLGVRQREKAKNKKLKKKEMKKAHRLRGIIASGTNHGQLSVRRRRFV
jgi:hypothetical protein